MSKLKNYLLNEETNEFVIHLLTLLPDFSYGNANPHDIIEQLSKYHGMSNEEVNTKLLNILFEILLGKCTQDLVGKHNDIPDEDFNQEELKLGIFTEYEHTQIPWIAKSIAKDHIMETPKGKSYYLGLIELEKKLGSKD